MVLFVLLVLIRNTWLKWHYCLLLTFIKCSSPRPTVTKKSWLSLWGIPVSPGGGGKDPPVRHTSGAVCASSQPSAAVRDSISCLPVVSFAFKGQGKGSALCEPFAQFCFNFPAPKLTSAAHAAVTTRTSAQWERVITDRHHFPDLFRQRQVYPS